jgi:predicted amidohydrolase
MQENINIALAQMRCKVGDKQQNIKKMKTFIANAKKQKAQLIIFPELSLTGYTIRDLTYDLAEPIPGPSIEAISEITKEEKVYVVFGMPERSLKARNLIYNTAVLLGPEGIVGKYRKMHLPTHSVFQEKRYFRQGYQTPVFETPLGKIGLIVCYDIFFPEISRSLRLQGAKLIVCISASPAVRSKFFEVFSLARAMENTCFFAFVNLVGIEDGLQFWGGSRLVAPNGSVIVQAKYDEEDMVFGSVDYADLAQVEPFVPTLRDLRPELFDLLKNYSLNL